MLRIIKRGPYRVPQSAESLRLAEELAERLEAQEGALERNDAPALRAIPRQWLHSAGSETLNWIALGGAMQQARLKMELLDYVPVYRSPAGTGGGWAFARWR